MNKYRIKNKNDIKVFNVVFAVSILPASYEEERLLLLENMPDTLPSEYVLAEGYHCSCYDFNDIEWDCLTLTINELERLLINTDNPLRLELKRFIKNYF